MILRNHKLFIKYGVISVFCLLITAYFAGYIWYWEMSSHNLEIYFFDLNRGRSIFIRTPNKKTVLIDTGQSSEIFREITKITPFYRRRIDLLILTSALPKSAGSSADIYNRYEVDAIKEPILIGTSTSLDALDRVIKKKKSLRKRNSSTQNHIQYLKQGDSFDLDGIKFDTLFPIESFKYNKTSLPELVLKISYGRTSILLLGDASKTIQKSLIPLADKTNIVEYAHSGGDSKKSKELSAILMPDFEILSNRDGTEAFYSDGDQIKAKTQTILSQLFLVF